MSRSCPTPQSPHSPRDLFTPTAYQWKAASSFIVKRKQRNARYSDMFVRENWTHFASEDRQQNVPRTSFTIDPWWV